MGRTARRRTLDTRPLEIRMLHSTQFARGMTAEIYLEKQTARLTALKGKPKVQLDNDKQDELYSKEQNDG